MFKINNITNRPSQNQVLVLPDGTQITFQIYYSSTQQGWFITNLVYATKNFTSQGIRITTSPNILRQFKNQIPFGLTCVTSNGQEATQIQDFQSGFATLYILSEDDVQTYERFLES